MIFIFSDCVLKPFVWQGQVHYHLRPPPDSVEECPPRVREVMSSNRVFIIEMIFCHTFYTMMDHKKNDLNHIFFDFQILSLNLLFLFSFLLTFIIYWLQIIHLLLIICGYIFKNTRSIIMHIKFDPNKTHIQDF